MLPVYETRIFKDKILVTKVGRIHGDIWVCIFFIALHFFIQND